MRAIQISETGGPEVLVVVDLPTPEAGPGQLLVKVAAVGVNFIEIYYREGRYQAPLPRVLGSECSGTVVAVGAEVTGFSEGDAVVTTGALGSYAEYALVTASQAVRVPAGMDLKLAAAVILQGMTAHYLARSTWVLVPGETALVHAAAGGVGLLLTQIAKACGARVIATVSTDEKAELAKGAGADDIILYTQSDFEIETRRLTHGLGVDVVYDSVGLTTFEKSLKCLRPRGLLALYGGSSGAVPPFDLIRLSLEGSLFVTRPTLKDYILTREELDSRAGEVLGWVAEGVLRVRMEHLYGLEDAAQAQIDLAGRKTTGKLLLIP